MKEKLYYQKEAIKCDRVGDLALKIRVGQVTGTTDKSIYFVWPLTNIKQ